MIRRFALFGLVIFGASYLLNGSAPTEINNQSMQDVKEYVQNVDSEQVQNILGGIEKDGQTVKVKNDQVDLKLKIPSREESKEVFSKTLRTTSKMLDKMAEQIESQN